MDGASYPNELARGTPVGGYKIRQRIGGGATGTVYAALDPRSGRKVAIKVLHPRLSPAGDEALERLRSETARLAALRHPGLIAAQEVGRLEAGPVYLISEFALGQPLTDLLTASGPLAPAEARPLLEALALILATAHGHQRAHGGLSPDNIWVTPRDGNAWPPLVRVMDFGMAALRHQAAAPELRGDEVPYYLSPEQCRGEAPSPASDIYALGVIAYQLLTGRVPFSSVRPSEVVRMHLEEQARPPSELAPLSPAVDRVVLRALAKQPAERFQTMPELRAALGAFDEAWPSTTREAEGGYESYDLDDPRSERISGEIPARPAAEAPAPALETEAVIVEEGAAPPESQEGGSTAVLPVLEGAARRSSPLGAALLGLALAAALGLGAYRLLAGSWPWSGAAPPAEGLLQVVSVPPGARVFLDQSEQPGRTPLALRLQQGRSYSLLLRLEGREAWQQTVALALGEEERPLKVVLAEGPASFGTLKLHLSVAADVFLDGRRVGTQVRELTLAEVRAGPEHELRVVAPGHRALSERVRVSAGSTRVLELKLEPAPVTPR